MVDLFVTSVNIENTVSGVICADLNDQLPIFVAVDVASSKRKVCSFQKMIAQNITPVALNTLRSLLPRQNWEIILNIPCVDDIYDEFISVIKEAYIACGKYGTVTKPNKRKP